MDIIVIPLLLLIKSIIGFTVWIILADVIISWLIAMSIFNTNNRFVYSIIDTLSKISGFLLNPIRSRLPSSFGSIDISPVIFILFVTFIENIINRILMKIS